MNKKETIAYQGVPGAYSHCAASELFPNSEHIGKGTFEEVIESVNSGEAQYAVLPIENSTAGRVATMHTLLPKSGLHIIGEHFFRVNHQLIAKKGSLLEDIKYVYSHPQALAQSSDFIKKFNLTEVPYGDTADSVSYISKLEKDDVAAIASKRAAFLNDSVCVLAEDINTNKNNVTRFVILHKERIDNFSSDSDLITSVFFKTKNIPSALYKSLAGFAIAGINILKLESFVPMFKNDGASFYLEFDGSANTESAKQALLELSYYASEIIILGTYKKDSFRANAT